MQTGMSSSKVLVLMGAGLTGSVVLKNGQLSDLLMQLQELIKGVSQADISGTNIDGAALASQIRQLAQEIRALSLSNPVTIYNGSSTSSGGYASYLVPAATVGAMGYCYMWWKGFSFSDVMFVTKKNMSNAVDAVSKQLEGVSDALALTKRVLSKKLENVDWKVEEQKEMSKLIATDVTEVKSNLSQIGTDIDFIHQLVTGLEGKLELLESKQDLTNSGLWYLCQMAGGIKDGLHAKLFQDVESNLVDQPRVLDCQDPMKGLQYIVASKDSTLVEKPLISIRKDDLKVNPRKNVVHSKTRIHRSYAVGISLTGDLV